LKAVLILSGSADSSALAYWMKIHGYIDLICITYNYEQNQILEIESAKTIAKILNATHRIIDIRSMEEPLNKMNIADNSIFIPQEAWTKETNSITAWTTLFLSTAWTIACEEKADVLAYGAQCKENKLDLENCLNYFSAMNIALRSNTVGFRKDNLELITPLLRKSRIEMIKLRNDFGVFNHSNSPLSMFH